MRERLKRVHEGIRKRSPMVHNITNYVTVNDCANIQLAFGGNPIMADSPREAASVVSCCSALVINIGTLNEETIKSMKIAGQEANRRGIPVVLDPVGYGFTGLRTTCVDELLEEIRFSVIKGNISEIKGILNKSQTSRGVDVSKEDAMMSKEDIAAAASELSKIYGCTVVVTGRVDVIAEGDRLGYIYNGHEMMSHITGTGCMLGAMLGVAAGGMPEDLFSSSLYAVGMMGVCGESASIDLGERRLFTLKGMILDNISSMKVADFLDEVRYIVI